MSILEAVDESAIGTESGDERSLTAQELAGIVEKYAAPAHWLDRVRLQADGRWYERLYHGSTHDVWLISWMPGQSTGFHDHGKSAGAFLVTAGSLEEHRPGEPRRAVGVGDCRWFGPDYAHDVGNVSNAPAISIHAYSPPLTEMNAYELEGDRLVPRISEGEFGIDEDDPRRRRRNSETRASGRSIDEMLAIARARLRRLSPTEAYEAAKDKAVLVDIRPESQRATEGLIEGAFVVERNVLEWRFDPRCSARLPIASTYDLQVIVFCSEGYTSSLAATALQELGLWRATDIVGGIEAWRQEGLPIQRA